MFKKYGLDKKENFSLQSFLLAQDQTKNIYPGYSYFRRSNSQEKIGELENRNIGCHYLASILDLTALHISQLENLKKTCLTHLEKIYKVTPQEDLIELYFHFPYPDSTTTLHLHIRINFGRHPMEKSRSFYLDEVISALKNGKSIKQLILERSTYYTDDFDILKDISGITLNPEAKNPYVISSPHVKISSSYSAYSEASNNGKKSQATAFNEEAYTIKQEPTQEINQIKGIDKEVDRLFYSLKNKQEVSIPYKPRTLSKL